MHTRILTHAIVLLALLLAALALSPSSIAGPDLSERVLQLEQQVANLTTRLTSVQALVEEHARLLARSEGRVADLESYLAQLRSAFAGLAPDGAAPGQAGAPSATVQVERGRADVLRLVRRGHEDFLLYDLLSGQIRNLPDRARLELEIQLCDKTGAARKTFTLSETEVVQTGQVVHVVGELKLSTLGTEDTWVREIAAAAEADRRALSEVIITFRVRKVLPLPR